MPEKFQNKYRIQSNRLQGWNYAANGCYFITIVTHGREQWFGEVVNGQMVLNDIGQIVYNEFINSSNIRNELFLGDFVIMPNHLHAIVTLDKTACNNVVVENHGRISLQRGQQIDFMPPKFERQPQSISSFVAGFKSSAIQQIDNWIDATNQTMAKFNRDNPLWQANYYDHIVRNATEYQNIANYIANNPLAWANDKLK